MTPSSNTMTLAAQDLSCERNGRLLFSDLSFRIRGGECAELRGANGAGKSSLLRLLAGLVPKAGGTVHFNSDIDFEQNLHFIAHQDAMKPAMTVAENLQFWCDVLGGFTIAAALQAFHMEDLQNQATQLLSAGQRRRLTLSRLFICERPIWLLDEPMTALDVASQDLLRQHMKTHLGQGGLIVAATHGDLGLTPHHVIALGSA